MGRHSHAHVHQQGQRPIVPPVPMKPVEVQFRVPHYGLVAMGVEDTGLYLEFLEHRGAAQVELDDVGALRELRDGLTVFLDRNKAG